MVHYDIQEMQIGMGMQIVVAAGPFQCLIRRSNVQIEYKNRNKNVYQT